MEDVQYKSLKGQYNQLVSIVSKRDTQLQNVY